MLASAHRMRAGSDFAATMRRGQRSGTPRVVVHLAQIDDPPGSSTLVGFVVSKAVGNAVVRNTVKRRMRHLMAERLTDLPAGSRVVVRALPPSADASSDDLARDLTSLLGRLSRRSSSAAGGGERRGPR